LLKSCLLYEFASIQNQTSKAMVRAQQIYIIIKHVIVNNKDTFTSFLCVLYDSTIFTTFPSTIFYYLLILNYFINKKIIKEILLLNTCFDFR